MRLAFADQSEVMHATLGPGRMRAIELGNMPDEQVANTISVMSKRAAEDARNPEFQAHAAGVFGGAPTSEVLKRAFDHVRGAIQFHRDDVVGAGLGDAMPDDLVEFIIRPVDMARYVDQGVAIGDCDDFSMYLAALLKTQGVDCKFCTVAADAGAPDQFSHVYVVAYVDGERVPMDASHGQYPGWEVPNRFEKRTEWKIGECSIISLAALAATVYFGINRMMEARA